MSARTSSGFVASAHARGGPGGPEAAFRVGVDEAGAEPGHQVRAAELARRSIGPRADLGNAIFGEDREYLARVVASGADRRNIGRTYMRFDTDA